MVMGDDAKSAVEVDAVITIISQEKLAEAAPFHSKNVCETATAPPLPPTADSERLENSPTSYGTSGCGGYARERGGDKARALPRSTPDLFQVLRASGCPVQTMRTGACRLSVARSCTRTRTPHSCYQRCAVSPAWDNASLLVVEEVMPSMVNELKLESTFSENELINGDMIMLPAHDCRAERRRAASGVAYGDGIPRRAHQPAHRPLPATARTTRSISRSPCRLLMTPHRRQGAGGAAAKPPQMIKIVLSAKSSSGQVMEKLTARLCAADRHLHGSASLRQAP